MTPAARDKLKAVADSLRAGRARRFATAAELRAFIEDAQDRLDAAMSEIVARRPAGEAITTCSHPGCNRHVYPASPRFCLFHSSSNDSFAGQLRRLEAAAQ